MTICLLVLLGIQVDSDSMDRLIERLGDASIEARTKAEATLIRRAREWSDADVQKLERTQEDSDAEKAAKARSALAWIRRFRTIPPEIWKAVPDLARRMMSSKGEEIGSTLSVFEGNRDSLPPKALIPLLIDLLGDERDSGAFPYLSSGPGPASMTVGELSARILAERVARFRADEALKKARDWWKENRDKSEPEWHLADLSHADEWVRAISARRLGELKHEAAIPAIVKVLPGFESSSAFACAALGFAHFPAEVRIRELTRYLRDTRYPVRFAVARALPDESRAEAARSIIQAFQHRSRVTELRDEWWDSSEAYDWLARTGWAEAREALFRFAGEGSGSNRATALMALEAVADPRVDERLAKATSDATTHWGERIQHRGMHKARVGDIAALILSRRLKIDSDFEWPESIRTRNRNIESVLNRWRESRRLPRVEYLGPGIAAVPPDKVKSLIPDLISKDAGTREASQVRLSELGPGAWRILLAEATRLAPEARTVLDESARRAANSLRSLQFDSQDAKALEPALRERMHRPLDLEALARLIGQAWHDLPRAGKLTCEVIRGADGIGFSIRLALEPADTTDRIPSGRNFDFGNGSSWSAVSVSFLDEFKERLEALDPALADPELQARSFFSVEWTYEKDR